MNESIFDMFEALPKESPMTYPKTAAEWWSLAESHRDNLRRLVLDFHPAARSVPKYWDGKDFPITARNAESACLRVREEISREFDGDVGERFDALLKGREAKLAVLLNETWFGIPESVSAHSIPGFGVLCDLCSEAGVLFAGDEVMEGDA